MFSVKQNILASIVCFSAFSLAHAHQDASEDKVILVLNYFSALEKARSPDATELDTNRLMSLLSDDFVLFHSMTPDMGQPLRLTKKMLFDSLQTQREQFIQYRLHNHSMYAGENMGMLLYEESFAKANNGANAEERGKKIIVEVLIFNNGKVIASNKFIETQTN